MSWFADRTKRLSRRRESAAFRVYIMPVSWLVCLTGLAGLTPLFFAEGFSDVPESPLLRPLAALAATPPAVFFLRVIRGHFHKDIREH